MPSIASARPAFRRLAPLLFCVLPALPAWIPSADAQPLLTSAKQTADLRIVPFDEPGVVGVRRLDAFRAPGGATSTASADAATWRTDYSAALEQAAREKKILLLNFTGSDWCGWCQRLEADVFSKPEFKAHAARHWVLVKVDFPRKSKLPLHESTQNARLQREFAVRGFPTIVAVDAHGKRVAEIQGYVRGGPKAFITTLEQQLRR